MTMFRFCNKSISLQAVSIIKNIIYKDITSNKKVIAVLNNNLSRHYASSIEEKGENKAEKIYYGTLTPQIRAVKIFSLSSSMAGLLAQPIIIKEAATIGSTSLLIAMCSVVGFFTFVTPLLLHFITKKYVTEIEFDPETSTYRATTINFFLGRNKLDFKVDDVEVPDIPGMFTTLKAKGKPLFVEARHFSDPFHYAKMMGYDKPIDFKLGVPESSSDSKKQ